MNEHIKSAVDYAFADNVADMQQELVNAVSIKVADALEYKKAEIAQNLLNQNEEVEELEELSPGTLRKYIGKNVASTMYTHSDDIPEKRKKGLKTAYNKLNKESYIEEKLSVEDGVDAWIKDFVHSDDPRFEGKSKKERIQMALGAFYAAKKGTNEEADIDESQIGWMIEKDPKLKASILAAKQKRRERKEMPSMPVKKKK